LQGADYALHGHGHVGVVGAAGRVGAESESERRGVGGGLERGEPPQQTGNSRGLEDKDEVAVRDGHEHLGEVGVA